MRKSKITRNPQILDAKAQKLGYDTYEDYLDYDVYWHMFRLRNIRGRCWCCPDGGKSQMRLHHIHYERMGAELPEDVVTLCNWCHRKAHKMVCDGAAKLAYAHILLRQDCDDADFQRSLNFDDACNQQVPEPASDLLWDTLFEQADEGAYPVASRDAANSPPF